MAVDLLVLTKLCSSSIKSLHIYIFFTNFVFTYDHRILNPALPVRSAVLKQDTGGLVVRWVTTGEYPLLYVFDIFWLLASSTEGKEKEENVVMGGLLCRMKFD